MFPIITIAAMALAVEAAQHPFTSPTWAIRMDPVWDVLGPFPIHAREQHFLSPAYPLNLSERIDYGQSWPSAFADNGTVAWSTTYSDPIGGLSIAFPQIRWERLRKTEGWAAFQHHAVLHTTLTLQQIGATQPSNHLTLPRAQISLTQASYFCIRPKDFEEATFVPRWYPGNIYDMERSEPISVQLPPSRFHEGVAEYDLFVSGDYEIRLFGDPSTQNQNFPTQQIRMGIEIESREAPILHIPLQDIICDFVNGWAFGTALGVSVKSTSSSWRLATVSFTSARKSLELRVANTTKLAPSQTRIIPLVIHQTDPFHESHLELTLHFKSDHQTHRLSISVPIFQREIDIWDDRHILRATFLDASLFAFIAIPPSRAAQEAHIPVVALHGAGVDILSQDFWANALPDNTFHWIIIPVGGTSWGLDWHGPSSNDVTRALHALRTLLREPRAPFHDRLLPTDDKIVLIGHSNGGQGTWFHTARHPDRVIAAIPAAAYIKSQAYIPLTLSRGAHFIDPSLRAILESALTPDDNDLYLSNLPRTPILAIHGGNDDNVPTWHNRQLVASLKAWYPNANVQFREDRGEGHWYAHLLRRPFVQEFVDSVTKPKRPRQVPPSDFTLTSACPREMSSLYGFKIEQLKVPGRLGRLRVRADGPFAHISTTNVRAFSIAATSHAHSAFEGFHLDGNKFVINDKSETKAIFGWNDLERAWQRISNVSNPAPTRVQAILSSSGPLVLIVSSQDRENAQLAASRIAFVLHVYHRLDAEIIEEEEALERDERGTWSAGNVIFIGPPGSSFANMTINRKRTPVELVDFQWLSIGGVEFRHPGHAALFLHPHPGSDDSSSLALMLFITYNSQRSLERALRLFPYRTGVAVPSWVVVSDEMDRFGAAGTEAAGVWGANWEINERMAWFKE